MSKFALIVLALVLAGRASAAGWRDLRIDASSEAAFEQTLVAFKEELSPGRRYVLVQVLNEIRRAGTQAAATEQREYAPADFLRQIDGLSYEELVRSIDSTGAAARRYRAAYNPYSAGDRRSRVHVAQARSAFPAQTGPTLNLDGQNMRGRTPLTGPGLQQ